MLHAFGLVWAYHNGLAPCFACVERSHDKGTANHMHKHAANSLSYGTSFVHAYYINLKHRVDRQEQLLLEFAKVGWPLAMLHRVTAHQHLQRLAHDRHSAALGATLSHILALTRAQRESASRGADIVAVFEDDFQWSDSIPVSSLKKLLHRRIASPRDWNVTLLACNPDSSDARCSSTAQSSGRCSLHGKLLGTPYGTYYGRHGAWAGLNARSPAVKGLDRRVIEAWARVPHHKCQTSSGYLIRTSYIANLVALWQRSADEVQRRGRIYNVTPSLAGDQVWKDLQVKGNDWFVSQPHLGMQRPGMSDIQKVYTNYTVSKKK